MASVQCNPNSPRHEIEPAAVYGQEGSIRLHIATGGAGGTGLLKAFADAFIDRQVKTGSPPFRIAWIATDTSLSFNALASGAADVSIVYHPYAVQLALKQGVATRTEYAWRDHFMLVGMYALIFHSLRPACWNLAGPASNPARLPTTNPLSIHIFFSQIFLAAIRTNNLPSDQQVRFLSRYDKSANNIRESSIWTSIGQTPWSEPYSTWYHRYVDMPIGALRAASRLGEYTLVDRGTWYAVEESVKEGLVVYVSVQIMMRSEYDHWTSFNY